MSELSLHQIAAQFYTMRDNNPFYLGDSADLSHPPICISPSPPALHLNSPCTFLLFYFHLSLSLFFPPLCHPSWGVNHSLLLPNGFLLNRSDDQRRLRTTEGGPARLPMRALHSAGNALLRY